MATRIIGPARTSPAIDRARAARWPVLLFALALPLGIAARIAGGRDRALWLDETFTAVIADQPTVAALVGWCLEELSGPGYYAAMWAWVQLAGPSNLALRTPGFALSVGAALLVAWKGHSDRTVRLAWAAALLLWYPALAAATEARPYPWLLFLGTVQAIAFLRAATTPTLARALTWSGIGALLVLTHYHALAITVAQALALVALHRRAALRCWPALLPFVPVAGWMAVHVPFVLQFAEGHAGRPLAVASLAVLPGMLSGLPIHGLVVALAMTASLVGRTPSAGTPPGERMLVRAAIGAVAAEIVLGLLQPGFAPRYLTPSMPGILFGVALWMRRTAGDRPTFVLAVAGTAMLPVAQAIRTPAAHDLLEIERPSAWLAEARPERLIFLWDDRVGAASPDRRVAEVAGFFLRRGGMPVPVVVTRSEGSDPNRLLPKLADRPGDAILWISGEASGSGVRPRLRVTERECRDFGGGIVTLTACRPRR